MDVMCHIHVTPTTETEITKKKTFAVPYRSTVTEA